MKLKEITPILPPFQYSLHSPLITYDFMITFGLKPPTFIIDSFPPFGSSYAVRYLSSVARHCEGWMPCVRCHLLSGMVDLSRIEPSNLFIAFVVLLSLLS
jgi:hypothetical protein